jgi:hypothetical protein
VQYQRRKKEKLQTMIEKRKTYREERRDEGERGEKER